MRARSVERTITTAPFAAAALLGLAVACAAPGTARAGPPFVTDDPVPVEYGGWEINSALTGTLVAGGASAGAPSIDANYGAWPGVQIHLQPQLSVVWDRAGTRLGVGDTQIGAKIRLIDEDKLGWLPMVSVYPIFNAPSGSARRGLGTGLGGVFLPVWADKSFGKWTIDGGGGVSINPRAEGRNALFLGGLILYQFTDALSLGGEVFEQTAQRSGEPDETGFNLGGSYDLSHTTHLLFSAGRGLAHVASTNRFSFYLAVQLAL